MLVKKYIGDNQITFSFSGKSLFDCAMEAEKVSFSYIPECGLCKSKKLHLKAYETKEDGYKYVKVVCSDCKASLTFGQPKKSPDTYYPRKNEDGKYDWKAYEKKESDAF